jgi:hypothetical protein
MEEREDYESHDKPRPRDHIYCSIRILEKYQNRLLADGDKKLDRGAIDKYRKEAA